MHCALALAASARRVLPVPSFCKEKHCFLLENIVFCSKSSIRPPRATSPRALNGRVPGSACTARGSSSSKLAKRFVSVDPGHCTRLGLQTRETRGPRARASHVPRVQAQPPHARAAWGERRAAGAASVPYASNNRQDVLLPCWPARVFFVHSATHTLRAASTAVHLARVRARQAARLAPSPLPMPPSRSPSSRARLRSHRPLLCRATDRQHAVATALPTLHADPPGLPSGPHPLRLLKVASDLARRRPASQPGPRPTSARPPTFCRRSLPFARKPIPVVAKATESAVLPALVPTPAPAIARPVQARAGLSHRPQFLPQPTLSPRDALRRARRPSCVLACPHAAAAVSSPPPRLASTPLPPPPASQARLSTRQSAASRMSASQDGASRAGSVRGGAPAVAAAPAAPSAVGGSVCRGDQRGGLLRGASGRARPERSRVRVPARGDEPVLTIWRGPREWQDSLWGLGWKRHGRRMSAARREGQTRSLWAVCRISTLRFGRGARRATSPARC